tara:strand:- start:290 stop:502 length:213 start_codon:yes stop_codon:yes gene_type:complete
MEQITDGVGNPIALLIERIFWLCLGGFFGLAVISSLLRGLNENRNINKTFDPKGLKDLAKKAIQQNNNDN